MKKIIIAFSIMTLLSLPARADRLKEEVENSRLTNKHLFLLRSSVVTHRAVFTYAGDCEFIAKIMNKAEPEVKWFCKSNSK